MNDGASLLRAILAQPDEDTPRLVYADWLQENGESERAEFIRVQCELARLPGGLHCCHLPDFTRPNPTVGEPLYHCAPGCPLCRKIECEARERDLFHAGTWRQYTRGPFALVSCLPMEWYVGMSVIGVARRGFVESVTCAATDFLEHAAELFAAHPVTSVRLTDCEPAQWIPEIRGLPSGCAGRWFWSTHTSDELWRNRSGARQILPSNFRFAAEWLNAKWYMNTPTYDTRELADAALHRVCIAYGREAAGLPPLPEPDKVPA